MGRRDEIEPRFGWLATVGAAVGILLLLVVIAVAGIDAGDDPPDTGAVAEWLGRDAEVVRCEDTGTRLPALDPVTVYRCDLRIDGRSASGCFGLDGSDVVAGGTQLANVAGCVPRGLPQSTPR